MKRSALAHTTITAILLSMACVDSAMGFPYHLTANPNYFGGDMPGGLGVPAMDGQVAGFIESGTYTYWPKGIVYWEFDLTQGTGFNETEFNKAINEIETKTCVRFKKRNGNRAITSYVRVTSMTGEGCNSFVGMYTLGSQRLQLQPLSQLPRQPTCWVKGYIAHELMHAMGFNHEHQRFDRNLTISVNFTNVNPNFTFAFAVIPESETLKTGLQPYDFTSVMHYRWNSFGLPDGNGGKLQTIFVNGNLSYQIQDPQGLSASDAAMVNAVYRSECNARDNPTTTQRPSKLGSWNRFFDFLYG